MNNWTEENQKAEFLGGAIAGGCGIIIFIVIFALITFGAIASMME